MRIKLTKHAKLKADERSIQLSDISSVVMKPERVEPDRFDAALTHFIGRINDRFLRIIGRKESEDEIVVISAFFDRRLSRRMRHDKA